MELNHDQSIALLRFKAFINNDKDVFILHGYAGTGKTTLIKEMIQHLKSKSCQVVLMASTGRAARVLFDRVLEPADTVHRTIYHLEETGLNKDETVRFTRFALHESDKDVQAVYICDESSMLSDRNNFTQELSFGSGRLITDLFTHVGKRKVVFVGDPSQLPPVNANFSAALSEEYLSNELNKTVEVAKLTQVMRYKVGTGKYENSVLLREDIELENTQKNPKILAYSMSDFHVYSSEDQLVRSFAALTHEFGIDQMCCIANSNAKVFNLNEQIRKFIFKDKAYKMNKGESLLVMHNNYLYNLYNGDSVTLIEASNHIETRGGVHFRQVIVQSFDKDGLYRKQCLIVEDLLHQNTPTLANDQEAMLFKDFIIRMREKGIDKKQDEKRFFDEMKSDRYLNALRVKYGYAMTCHKAQGGEWPHVFIVLEPHLFTTLPKPHLHRWLYTAFSRASSRVHISKNLCLR